MLTIIGAGNMGRGIGTRAVAGGHEVEIIDNDPAEAKALADELLDVFVAGDDESARKQVTSLVEGGGLRPLDVGPLRRSRQLEELMFLNMTIQKPLGLDFQSGIKIVS